MNDFCSQLIIIIRICKSKPTCPNLCKRNVPIAKNKFRHNPYPGHHQNSDEHEKRSLIYICIHTFGCDVDKKGVGEPATYLLRIFGVLTHRRPTPIQTETPTHRSTCVWSVWESCERDSPCATSPPLPKRVKIPCACSSSVCFETRNRGRDVCSEKRGCVSGQSRGIGQKCIRKSRRDSACRVALDKCYWY